LDIVRTAVKESDRIVAAIANNPNFVNGVPIQEEEVTWRAEIHKTGQLLARRKTVRVKSHTRTERYERELRRERWHKENSIVTDAEEAS